MHQNYGIFNLFVGSALFQTQSSSNLFRHAGCSVTAGWTLPGYGDGNYQVTIRIIVQNTLCGRALLES
jgi:hypothetical protein